MVEDAGAGPKSGVVRSVDWFPCTASRISSTPTFGLPHLGNLVLDLRKAGRIRLEPVGQREERTELRRTHQNKISQRLPTRLTGPPRFIGVPGRTPTPGAPTPGVTTARATGRGRSTTPGRMTQPTG